MGTGLLAHRGRRPASIRAPLAAVLSLAVLVLVGYQLSLQRFLPRITDVNTAPVPQQAQTQSPAGGEAENNVDRRLQRSASPPRRRLEPQQQAIERDNEVVVGNTTYHPSFGMFPQGCRWRLVTDAGGAPHRYQFWDFEGQRWVDDRPAACVPTTYAPPGPPGWQFYRESPRTEVACEKSHCMYTNLYYNNGRWYALVDGDAHIPSWRFSRNQEIVTLHVQNASDFLAPAQYRIVPGDTILFDFIFFIHPTAIGHWWEMLGPLYSILKTANFRRPCDQFILLHLQRQHLLEWVRAMVAVTLGVGLSDRLPPVLVQEETDNAWHQIS